MQGRVTPVGVPTPQTRSATSASTSSNTGARTVVAETANQRRQRELRMRRYGLRDLWACRYCGHCRLRFLTKFLGLYVWPMPAHQEVERQLPCQGQRFSKCLKEEAFSDI